MVRQTYMAKASDVDQRWHVVDANDRVLGRLASSVATILMGKHKPTYTPHVDTGDFVVIVNAAKVKLTGRKAQQKFRLSYSGYPGGQKAVSYESLLASKPERLIEDAVRRMLPKNNLGRLMLKKLKIYRDADHPHTAQQPEPLEV